MKKWKVAVVFGGKSAEHDVSLASAKNVISALDTNKYEILEVKIERDGKFDPKNIEAADVVFPVLHGPYGEDGSFQGYLKIMGKPFVGPSVLGSALGMDKDVMKRILRDAGVPIGKFVTVNLGGKINFEKVKSELGLPLFIKPANMGSSVGISKATDEKTFTLALELAFKYDTKVIIEEFILGREIECAVLGNENPEASVLGEIIPEGDFYSYDAKYVTDSKTIVDVKLDDSLTKKIQTLAVKVFALLNCEGMSRVDFFLKKDGSILVNEINTIPGFTNISMYPKLWEASGISQTVLLDKLIELALERNKREGELQHTA
jgi:D-alanine-D-alanine ligase